jgi:hypothetical protein
MARVNATQTTACCRCSCVRRSFHHGATCRHAVDAQGIAAELMHRVLVQAVATCCKLTLLQLGDDRSVEVSAYDLMCC